MKKIAILGSTGSIGTQTVDILPSIDAEVVALTTNRRINLLEEQARALHPKMVCAMDENAAKALKIKLADTDITVLTGMDGLIACAAESGADIVVTAVVGMVGLLPTMAAIKAGKDIALANKETLVCAGGLVMSAAKQYGVRILPVDSGAFGYLPVRAGGKRQPDRQNPADSLRRSVLRQKNRGNARHDARAGTCTPELEHGCKDYDRLRDHDEQGPGADRSHVAV